MMPQPVFDLVRFPGGQAVTPSFPGERLVVRMEQAVPAVAIGGAVRHAGELVPAPVIVVVETIGAGGPYDLRQCVGDGAQAIFRRMAGGFSARPFQRRPCPLADRFDQQPVPGTPLARFGIVEEQDRPQPAVPDQRHAQDSLDSEFGEGGEVVGRGRPRIGDDVAHRNSRPGPQLGLQVLAEIRQPPLPDHAGQPSIVPVAMHQAQKTGFVDFAVTRLRHAQMPAQHFGGDAGHLDRIPDRPQTVGQRQQERLPRLRLLRFEHLEPAAGDILDHREGKVGFAGRPAHHGQGQRGPDDLPVTMHVALFGGEARRLTGGQPVQERRAGIGRMGDDAATRGKQLGTRVAEQGAERVVDVQPLPGPDLDSRHADRRGLEGQPEALLARPQCRDRGLLGRQQLGRHRPTHHGGLLCVIGHRPSSEPRSKEQQGTPANTTVWRRVHANTG